jgi:hypothetical protein
MRGLNAMANNNSPITGYPSDSRVGTLGSVTHITQKSSQIVRNLGI